MEKYVKIILIVVLSIFIFQFFAGIFIVNPQIRSSLQNLENSQMHLDSAFNQIKSASKSIDSIRISLLRYNNYLIAIQAQTAFLFKDRELKEARFKAKRDSIMAELAILKIKFDTISLPALKIYDSREIK